jgi:hypothetical protein
MGYNFFVLFLKVCLQVSLCCMYTFCHMLKNLTLELSVTARPDGIIQSVNSGYTNCSILFGILTII